MILFRLGSQTMIDNNTIKNYAKIIKINSIEGINISRNKLLMKRKFEELKLDTPLRYIEGDLIKWASDKYPIVSKSFYGSQGKGNTIHETEKSFTEWLNSAAKNNYIYEQYVNYTKEFRIHCSKNGIFSVFRKLRKNDSEERWYFNSKNCIFKIINIEDLKKYPCFINLEKQLIEAINGMQMDILAFDVRINKDYTKFTIIESNSAPSLLLQGTLDYSMEILKIISQNEQD